MDKTALEDEGAADLGRNILTAHRRSDYAALVDLYASAAAACSNDIDQHCFFLTYSYVFALELGHPRAPQLYKALARHNRV